MFARIAMTMMLGCTISAAAEFCDQPLAQIKDDCDQHKAVLLDVREQGEWNDGHVTWAIFLPLSMLRKGLTDADAARLPKDKIIYIHCAVGMRAMSAAKILEKSGYIVRPIKAGREQLVEAGFPATQKDGP